MNTWRADGYHHYYVNQLGRILAELMVFSGGVAQVLHVDGKKELKAALEGRRYIDLFSAQRDIELELADEFDSSGE